MAAFVVGGNLLDMQVSRVASRATERRRQKLSVCMKKVPELTDREFKSAVLESDTPVLVDFYATWCGPCKLVSPIVEWAGAEYKENLKVYKVNIDNEPEYVKQYHVNALPHLVLFRDGEAVFHVTGLVKKAELSERINMQVSQ